ncbi:MAG: protein kinase [Candidatus Eremiobacterota bacterium]
MRDVDGNLTTDTILQERYKIVNLIQKGPASRMYKAFDTKRNKSVFVKELIATYTDPSLRHQAIEQFKSEAKILFKLKQENLPKFEDYFDYEENRYLIIEYIEGKRLNNIVESQSGFLDEQQVIKWGIELCDSLGYLHNLKPNPVIFRDLSPQSILLSENDGRLKLIDFGISKIYESDAKTMGIAKTMTQHYSPIEQHAGTTDNRSDIYSLGATLYYLICKEPPMDCVERIIDDEPMEKCSKFNSSISKELEKIIMKAMEVDKKDRYQKIEEMRAELAKTTSAGAGGRKQDRPAVKPVFHRKEEEEEHPQEEEEGDSDYKPISFQMEHHGESGAPPARQTPGIKGRPVLTPSSQGREQTQGRTSGGAQSAQTRPFTMRKDQAKPAGAGSQQPFQSRPAGGITSQTQSQAKPAGASFQQPYQTKPAGKQAPLQTKPFTRTPSVTEGRGDMQSPRRRILEDRGGQAKTPAKSPALPPLQQTPVTDDTEYEERRTPVREEEPPKITAKLNLTKRREEEEEDLYDDEEEMAMPEENYEKNLQDLTKPKKHFNGEEIPQKKLGVIQRILKFLFRLKV